MVWNIVRYIFSDECITLKIHSFLFLHRAKVQLSPQCLF